MKIILALLLCVGVQPCLHAQVPIAVTGEVKSSHGGVSKAEISFLDLNNVFLSNCISGPDGKFKSQNKFQPGKEIKVRITMPGYQSFERKITIRKDGDAGEFKLLPKKLTISGYVKDSISQLPIPGAEVFFYDDSKLIQSRSTNSFGYFDFETEITYGQTITISVLKSGYHQKKGEIILSSEKINEFNMMLPKIEHRGLKAFITVADKKTGIPVAGAKIHYLITREMTYKEAFTTSDGKAELTLYQLPGTKLEIEVSKPNYRTIKASEVLKAEPHINSLTYELNSDYHSTLGSFLLITGGTAAIVSGVMYFSSKSKYERYKDLINLNRENDYKAAQSRRTVAVAGAIVTTGAMIGYIVHKANLKKKHKKAAGHDGVKTRFNRWSIESPSHAIGSTEMVCLVYRFR